jgi:hypothetical protein
MKKTRKHHPIEHRSLFQNLANPGAYAERAELKLRELPDERTRELRAWCARPDDLLDMIVAE